MSVLDKWCLIMRHDLEKILGTELRFLAIKTRNQLKLTQKEMGIKLHMSESSYSDIETGRTTCGTLTTVLLLDMQDDPKIFLKQLNKEFSSWYEKELQLV